MKSIIKQIVDNNRQMEKAESDAINKELCDTSTSNDRRNFLKKTALGGIALGGMMFMPFEDVIAQTTSKVKRASAPSDLKITDMRYALTGVMVQPLIVHNLTERQ